MCAVLLMKRARKLRLLPYTKSESALESRIAVCRQADHSLPTHKIVFQPNGNWIFLMGEGPHGEYDVFKLFIYLVKI
jgi:hypothetical protein